MSLYPIKKLLLLSGISLGFCFGFQEAKAEMQEKKVSNTGEINSTLSTQLSGSVSRTRTLQGFLEPYFLAEIARRTGRAGPVPLHYSGVLYDQQGKILISAGTDLAGGGISLKARVEESSEGHYKLLELKSESFQPSASFMGGKLQGKIKDLKLGTSLKSINFQNNELSPQAAGQGRNANLHSENQNKIPAEIENGPEQVLEANTAAEKLAGQASTPDAPQSASSTATPTNSGQNTGIATDAAALPPGVSPEAAGRMINAIRQYQYLNSGGAAAAGACPGGF